eukprot:365934-Chlamydomonas_euryale.AAC.4
MEQIMIKHTDRKQLRQLKARLSSGAGRRGVPAVDIVGHLPVWRAREPDDGGDSVHWSVRLTRALAQAARPACSEMRRRWRRRWRERRRTGHCRARTRCVKRLKLVERVEHDAVVVGHAHSHRVQQQRVLTLARQHRLQQRRRRRRRRWRRRRRRRRPGHALGQCAAAVPQWGAWGGVPAFHRRRWRRGALFRAVLKTLQSLFAARRMRVLQRMVGCAAGTNQQTVRRRRRGERWRPSKRAAAVGTLHAWRAEAAAAAAALVRALARSWGALGCRAGRGNGCGRALV